jgi:hypothetical protein
MNIDSQHDHCRGLRADSGTAAGHGRAPTECEAIPFATIGCARPGWLIRAYADPGRLRQVLVEWTVSRRRPRPPAPAWVRTWIRSFARR